LKRLAPVESAPQLPPQTADVVDVLVSEADGFISHLLDARSLQCGAEFPGIHFLRSGQGLDGTCTLARFAENITNSAAATDMDRAVGEVTAAYERKHAAELVQQPRGSIPAGTESSLRQVAICQSPQFAIEDHGAIETAHLRNPGDQVGVLNPRNASLSKTIE